MSMKNWLHKLNAKTNKLGIDLDYDAYSYANENDGFSNRIFTRLDKSRSSTKPDRLRVICEIQHILDELHWTNAISDFVDNLPRLVVVGAQSVGKTSILEHIIGHENVLPKGSGMVTRQPVLLRLYYDTTIEFLAAVSTGSPPPNLDTLKDSDASRSTSGFAVAKSPNALSATISRALSTDQWLVSTPLYVNIYSNKCPNLCLIDLPGLIEVPEDNQPIDLDRQIRDLITGFISQKNTIIIAVSPANQDIANSASLKLAREVDRVGDRTIGVISKFDLVGNDHVIHKVLRGDLYKLQYGYIPVVIDPEDVEATKKAFEALRSKLETVLFIQMSSNIHLMRQKFQEKHTDLSSSLSQLNYLDALYSHSMHDQKDSVIMNRKRNESLICSESSESSVLYSFVTALNGYTSSFEDVLCGRALISQERLIGGSLLIALLNGDFKRDLYAVNPIADITPEALDIAIKNCCGNSTYIFIPEKVFDLLIRQRIERLYPIVETYVKRSMALLLDMNDRVLDLVPLFRLFSNLKTAVAEQVTEFCRHNTDHTLRFCTDLVTIELSFINKRHPDFVRVFETTILAPPSSACTPRADTEFPVSATIHNKESMLPDVLHGTQASVSRTRSNLWQPLNFNIESSTRSTDSDLDVSIYTESDTNTRIIKILVSTYFEIVRKNLFDNVQKGIMHFLITGTQRSIQNNLVINLQPRLSALMQPDPGPLMEKENLNYQKNLVEKALALLDSI